MGQKLARLQAMKEQILQFYKNLEEMKTMLTEEDMKTALHSLKVATQNLQKLEQEIREAEQAEQAEAAARAAAEAEAKRIEEAVCVDLPMDWENSFADDERAAVRVDSVSDGLVLSLTTLGRVDIEYISAVTGQTCAEVIEALRGVIYRNPETWGECFYRGFETADEHLSGNLLRKWKIAKEANETYRGFFEENVTALETLLPDSVATEEIYVTLGSPWVPADIIDDFIEHIVNIRYNPAQRRMYSVRHDEGTGLWEIPDKTRFRHGRYAVKNKVTWGTARMEMLYLLENTLNMKTIAIHDTVKSNLTKSGTVSVLNETETVLALEKQEKMIKEFRKWVWQDKDRKDRLQSIYDARYGSIRKRYFDGSFLTFPTMNPFVSLYPYQKNAVARILFTPNTLLAHDVGSGKTYIMIAAGMEMRRIGTSKKNLYVVPNNLIGQWKDLFLSLYPHANLLTVEPRCFGKDKRNEVLLRMRDKDYDAILMAYSCFDLLPLSRSYYETLYEQTMRTLEEAKKVFRSKATLERKQKSVMANLEKMKKELEKSCCSVAFDELGINTLFVDEAHNYKNVPVETKITHVLGIGGSGSEKCRGMMDKAMCVQRQNGGRGVVLATGTPITNSITDVFVMQKYLQGGELAMLGLQSFDSWVGMFAEKTTEFEVDVDTNSYRMATRFSRFHNLPELTSILASVADFHEADKQNGIPDFYGYTDALIGRTDGFVNYLKEISRRADDVRSRRIHRADDNMLKITTDGRKAALDLRLVDPTAPFSYQSKAARCAENVLDLYRKTLADRCAQLIFCDSSTPKAGFHLYDELKRLLCSMGVPDSHIAYIHDATTEKKRNELFAAVREGRIRILIGSTFKLGLGVNVQERLVAVHHLDVPWRPADMVQREGRILRQGNTCERVMIFRYITEGSFDAYSWQLLETKQRFISQLLSGSVADRSGSDVDDTVLNYAEIKALAIGDRQEKDDNLRMALAVRDKLESYGFENLTVMLTREEDTALELQQRVEIANRLGKLFLLQREAAEERERMKRELDQLPAKIARQRELIEHCQEDIAFYRANKTVYDKAEAKRIREAIDAAIRTGADNPEETEILTYHGFRVVVPAYMKAEKPCVYLRREGKYYVELGAESGMTRRLDFFLEEFDRQEEKYRKGLSDLLDRRRALNEELKREVGYADEIAECRANLEKIDKRLGVKAS